MAVLSDDQIQARVGELDGWDYAGGALHKDFKLDDFKGSVDFVNRLTPIAEEMNHHPDLAISWDTVTVTLTTHSQGGVTDNDFELAEKLDALGA
jgi:4a-hydroxytetrahydrobiopterin dehydratase